MQTRITTYAAIGFMAAGFLFGCFTQNYRIGGMCVVLGGVLLASNRIIATVPDWAYSVLLVTAGVSVLVTPLAMWWGYRVGVLNSSNRSQVCALDLNNSQFEM